MASGKAVQATRRSLRGSLFTRIIQPSPSAGPLGVDDHSALHPKFPTVRRSASKLTANASNHASMQITPLSPRKHQVSPSLNKDIASVIE